jgi:hypothetical protein
MKKLLIAFAALATLAPGLAAADMDWNYWHQRVVRDSGAISDDSIRVQQDKDALARDQAALNADHDGFKVWNFVGDRDRVRADRDQLTADSAILDRDNAAMVSDRASMHDAEDR